MPVRVGAEAVADGRTIVGVTDRFRQQPVFGGDLALVALSKGLTGVVKASMKSSVPSAMEPFTPCTTVLKLSKVPIATCRTVPPCGAVGLT